VTAVRTRRLLPILLALVLPLAAARSASADATAFLGFTTDPTNRSARGFAIGIGLLIVGFEFEYAHSTENLDEAAPSLGTGMFNGLLQTPFPIGRLQLYATAGGGFYRERLATAQETNIAVNVGGGAKITLVGPVRLRLDYRLFRLSGSPLHSRTHRFYAGVNLKF
jgi:opacity protein-like surface antigen